MSRFDAAGLGIAIVVVAIMGVLAFHGPFFKINKTSASGAPSTAKYKPVTVKIVTDPKSIGRYTPHSITVHAGQPVIFENVSSTVHTVTADNNSFNSSDIPTSAGTWRYVPQKAGTFSYYCIYHPLMHGVLVVQS
jgi:plastocyanin